jgi:hypothetical protein
VASQCTYCREYKHIPEAPEAAAKRGVPVRILLAAPNNDWLSGSINQTQLSGMKGQIEVTLDILRPVAERVGSTFVVKVLRQKTMLVSLLRCDDRMLINALPDLGDDG